jgi:hypothetical protein
MRSIATLSIATILIAAGCSKEPLAPVQLESFPLRATVSPDNVCTVEALGQTFTSTGQVRGAVLPTFSGSLENAGYHAIGCWVAASDGSDGDLILTFAGDSYQQPFPIGTFAPKFEAPYGSTEKLVSVSFTTSLLSREELKTIDQSTGAVTVESTSSGDRTIHVDVSAIKFQY